MNEKDYLDLKDHLKIEVNNFLFGVVNDDMTIKAFDDLACSITNMINLHNELTNKRESELKL